MHGGSKAAPSYTFAPGMVLAVARESIVRLFNLSIILRCGLNSLFKKLPQRLEGVIGGANNDEKKISALAAQTTCSEAFQSLTALTKN